MTVYCGSSQVQYINDNVYFSSMLDLESRFDTSILWVSRAMFHVLKVSHVVSVFLRQEDGVFLSIRSMRSTTLETSLTRSTTHRHQPAKLRAVKVDSNGTPSDSIRVDSPGLS